MRLYQIHIDNVGDAQDHIRSSSSRSINYLRNGTGDTLTVGGKTLPIALRADGQINFPNSPERSG